MALDIYVTNLLIKLYSITLLYHVELYQNTYTCETEKCQKAKEKVGTYIYIYYINKSINARMNYCY